MPFELVIFFLRTLSCIFFSGMNHRLGSIIPLQFLCAFIFIFQSNLIQTFKVSNGLLEMHNDAFLKSPAHHTCLDYPWLEESSAHSVSKLEKNVWCWFFFAKMLKHPSENSHLWAQLFTSLKADLHQDINGGFAFSRCLNRTFPWRKCSVKAFVS